VSSSGIQEGDTARGDTHFTQTKHLDRWDEQGVKFVFGIDAMPNLKGLAESLSKRAWKRLHRKPKYEVKTEPRQRPDNVKEAIVRERGFQNIRTESEHVAEFSYSPTACKKTYRVVVLRKNLSVERGEKRLFDDIVYFYCYSSIPHPDSLVLRLVAEPTSRTKGAHRAQRRGRTPISPTPLELSLSPS